MRKCRTHYKLLGCIAELEDRWFYTFKNGSISNKCRICTAIVYAQKQGRPVNIAAIKQRQELIFDREELMKQGLRRCTVCKLAKDIKTEFFTAKNGKTYKGGAIYSYCKTCSGKRLNEWSEENRVTARITRRRKRLIDPITAWATLSNASHKKRYNNWTMTSDDIANLCRSGVGTCTYCKSLIIVGYNATVDVLNVNEPMVKENIALACLPCNSSKNNKPLLDYLELLKDPLIHNERLNSNLLLLRGYYASVIPIDELVNLAISHGATDYRPKEQ